MKRTFLAILSICASLIAVGETIDFDSGLKVELGDWTYEDGIFRSPTLHPNETSDLILTATSLGYITFEYIVRSASESFAGNNKTTDGMFTVTAVASNYNYPIKIWEIDIQEGSFTIRFTNQNPTEDCFLEFPSFDWIPAPDKVTVRFDPTLGTCSEKIRQYVPGMPYGDLPVAKREGCKFLGWATSFSYENFNGDDYNGQYAVRESSIVPVKGASLYARWGITADKVLNPSNTLDNVVADIADLGYYVSGAIHRAFNGEETYYENLFLDTHYFKMGTTRVIYDVTFHGTGRLTFFGEKQAASWPVEFLLDGKKVEYITSDTILVTEEGEHHLVLQVNNNSSYLPYVLLNNIRPIIWHPEPIPTFISKDSCSDDYLQWFKANYWYYYSDFTASDIYTASMKEDGHGKPYWMSYVAGIDPNNANSKLTASINMDSGKPRISITPCLGEKRIYTVYGSNDLKEWVEVDNSNAEYYHFFKVTVEMPETQNNL